MNPYPTEDEEQIALAQYLDMMPLTRGVWAHVPNGGLRFKPIAMKLKRMGTKPGVPDILIFRMPAKTQAQYVGTAIELKRREGGVVSPEQKEWLQMLALNRWATRVCYGFDDARRWLQHLGYEGMS